MLPAVIDAGEETSERRDMEAILRDLTEPQREAVSHLEGPLLILAGPGSGKTRVVTYRIANMLAAGIPPWQIAALTFTNKAADEMRARVAALAPGQPVWMGTFHRFCAQLLRRYAALVGLSENYSIYDSADAKQALKRAIEAAGVCTTHASPEQIAASISRAKNRLASPEMMQGHSLRPLDAIAARVYPVYQQQLLTANAADFDDLLFHIAHALRENSELRAELDARFRYILVDEYQDTNLAQYAIVRALSIDHPNLAVTGDPDQSIYGWRGADLNNILDFEKDYPSVKTVKLEQNYRSTPNILRVADQLIRHNRRRKHKQLFTDRPEGQPVVLRLYEDGYQEADSIADTIASTIVGEGLRPSDFAVFCRINAMTRSLEHALRSRSLPYQIVNGLEFYQRREIKDLLAYLHLINNPAHDVALNRIINVPTRGIGAKTIERIRRFADQHRMPMLEAARQADSISQLAKRSASLVRSFVRIYDQLAVKATAPLEDLLRHLIKTIDYEDYLEKTASDQQDNHPIANVDELITAAVEFDRQHPQDGCLESFLEQVALVSDTDAFEGSSDRVTLMTLHAAKGLEFPYVFIIGVEDELLPHKRARESEAQFEEERRLLFVGITRAKQSLQLSCCKRRAVRGEVRPVIPSPFLSELPLEEMQRIENSRDRDWFDADQDQGYPDSWDLPDEGIEQVRESAADAMPVTVPAMEKAVTGRLKTAADLLAKGTTPLTAYREGIQVRHLVHGEGTIVAVSGRGPKRIARVLFADGEHSFRLAFADLEVVS
jgi:DNA helicase-2/ATP-dependent DNA helicase PcrA